MHKILDFWKINTNKVEIEEVTTYGSNASHVPMEKCQSIWYCVQSIFKRVVRYDLFTNKICHKSWYSGGTIDGLWMNAAFFRQRRFEKIIITKTIIWALPTGLPNSILSSSNLHVGNGVLYALAFVAGVTYKTMNIYSYFIFLSRHVCLVLKII
jgi:hypothetical protein